jgi:Sap, sulfolipid-1-addressing protein
MLAQIAGFAVLAALSPAALLASAVFLGAANPRVTVLIFLSGALVMTVIVAAILFVVLHSGHLYKPHQHQARYGLRLGLGVVILAVGLYLRRRGPRGKDPAKQNQGLVARMIARPGPKTAFIVGLLVYGPSLTFVAAVQVVATSREPTVTSVLLLALIIAITVAFVWLPLVLHLFMPDRTGRLLASFNGWLRSHGRLLVVGALIVGGAVLTIDGILGLAGAVT